MTFPALDLAAMATRIHGVGVAPGLGYSGGISSDLTFLVAAVAGVEFRLDGTVGPTPGDNYSGDTVWHAGTFTASDFEIMATMISGTSTPTGNIPFGSFATLDIVRYLNLIRATPLGEETANFDITIREIAVPANTTTGRVTMFVNYNA